MIKIFIYDFDGTLTPYSMPKYDLVHKCNLTDEELYGKIKKYIKENNVSIYVAFYNILYELLKKNNIDINIENISLGADKIKLNEGVIEYFEKYKNYKHYVVTSGLKDYILKTKIGDYLIDVYGVEVNYIDKKIKRLLTDDDKIKAIKDIINKNKCNGSDIVYFGDGLTDMLAFSYVHEIGGKCVFINNTNNEIIDNEFIDIVVDADYSNNGEIDCFISSYL